MHPQPKASHYCCPACSWQLGIECEPGSVTLWCRNPACSSDIAQTGATAETESKAYGSLERAVGHDEEAEVMP